MNHFPSDWPEQGPIDLEIHDLPHRSSFTEWWYVNSHFETVDGQKLSIFAAFFRMAHSRDKVTKEVEYAHSVTWAISDANGKVYHADSRVDKRSPKIGLEQIKKGYGLKDSRLSRALAEILKKGRTPTPDRMFKRDVFVGEKQLELDFDGARFEKQNDGSYRLSLFNPRVHAGCDIVFHPEKPPIRHGDNGVIKEIKGQKGFYYFISRCKLTGTVTLNGIKQPIVSGSGWYDHNFGVRLPDTATKIKSNKGINSAHDTAWNWAGIQLDNGSEITAFSIVHCDTNKVSDQWVIVIDPNGRRIFYPDMKFEPMCWWRSTRTFSDYPTCWKLEVPEAEINLTIKACFDDQEFITFISKPAFWEGRCDVKGTIHGKQISGLAYVERSGFESIKDLDDFFSAVGEEVRKSVANTIPLEPTFEQARDLIASKEHEHYMKGVDISQLVRTLLKPIREITDRGGKSWRSYAALVCCDVVGGDSRKFVQWLAMPELIHVGSLVIDDVQDKSNVRRGGPTCHLVYGEPLAINAGTAAYFIGQKLLMTNELSNAQKLTLYDLYFEALRAGHAGQAIDIDGMYDLMPEVVKSGDSSVLEERILACHRLKTAAPASSLARMGAVAGGGTKEQIEAVGQIFEAIGLAFQIIDDVLNMRGFKEELKVQGEDITNGAVTLPIAKAMSRLSLKEREWVWKTLQSKPKDPIVVSSVIEKLEECGALDVCVKQATELVETTWNKIESKLEDSIPKMMLRAFGWYVLERHY